MDKRTELNNALKTAMKERDQVTLSTIRLILASLKDRDIAARGQGQADGVGDSDILSLMQSMIKQRQESSKTYRDASRVDLAEREEAEVEVVRRFMPQQMGENEMEQTVDGLIAELGVSDIKEMGKVMSALKSRYAGQLDMSKASNAVKERLAS